MKTCRSCQHIDYYPVVTFFGIKIGTFRPPYIAKCMERKDRGHSECDVDIDEMAKICSYYKAQWEKRAR